MRSLPPLRVACKSARVLVARAPCLGPPAESLTPALPRPRRRGGLEARIAAGHTPVACWYAGIGKLHTVHMIWHYASLEARREIRAASWLNDKWSNTVSRTVPLTQSMTSNILKALPYSPMR